MRRNIITQAELDALLTPDEQQQLEQEQTPESHNENSHAQQLAELQATVRTLMLRVEQLEQHLKQQDEILQALMAHSETAASGIEFMNIQSSMMERVDIIESPSSPPENIFIPRAERHRMKKKSIIQKLLD
jgi:hypothetical protein